MPAHARPRRIPRLARGAQLATVAALAAGCVAYAATGAAAGRPGPAATGSVTGDSAATSGSAVIPGRGAGLTGAAAQARPAQAERVSRSIARSSRVAVTAPAMTGPMRHPVGALGITAVVKPDPVKTFAAVAKATPSGSASGGATGKAAVAAASGGSTTAYAAAGAALGLSPSAIAVYSAVRSTFGITNIGGLRPGDWGDHGTGHAVDVMIASSGQGDAVAGFAIANAGRLNIKYVIWQQRIWMPSTGSWKLMADRGSPTQNHMDHVHISVN